MKFTVFGQRRGMSNRIKQLQLFVLLLACAFWIYGCSPEPQSLPNGTKETNSVSETRPNGDVASTVAPANADPDDPLAAFPGEFVKFQHGSSQHTRLPCLLCHNRADNSSRIRFPGKVDHLPCAGCHTLQFADKRSPICTICHTDPETGAMKRFSGLKSFGVKFDHARHTRANCTTCHKPQGRGIARSIPAGSSAHQTCFQCHTARSSDTMSSCNVCHVPGRLVRTPEWASAFGKGFSHSKHLDMNCAACHTVRAGFGRGKQMSSPLAAMHFAPKNTKSCASCHNGTKAFGPNDFTNCKRCHDPKTFRF